MPKLGPRSSDSQCCALATIQCCLPNMSDANLLFSNLFHFSCHLFLLSPLVVFAGELLCLHIFHSKGSCNVPTSSHSLHRYIGPLPVPQFSRVTAFPVFPRCVSPHGPLSHLSVNPRWPLYRVHLSLYGMHLHKLSTAPILIN